MYISHLFVRNFRNFRHLDVRLSDGVTCFIGENNSGKTNLFHAIRLVLDGNISAQRRRLQPEEFREVLSYGLGLTDLKYLQIRSRSHRARTYIRSGD